MKLSALSSDMCLQQEINIETRRQGGPREEKDITIFNIFNQPVSPKQDALLQILLQTINFLICVCVCIVQGKHDRSLAEAQQASKSLCGSRWASAGIRCCQ